MMIDKILASSFLDFVATYRLHLWNRKKTKILRSHGGKAVLVQVQCTASARCSKPRGLLPLLTYCHLLGSLAKNIVSINI